MEIKAPTFPESIADGSIAHWHFQEGEHVSADEVLVDIDKPDIRYRIFRMIVNLSSLGSVTVTAGVVPGGVPLINWDMVDVVVNRLYCAQGVVPPAGSTLE